MVANIEKIVTCCLALITSAGKHLKRKWQIWLFSVVLLVVVLSALFILDGCTTNHYFSVSAEEMSNPRIEYKDSTNLQNPW